MQACSRRSGSHDHSPADSRRAAHTTSRRIAVCLEVTPRQTFASALDWPGWRRAGRDEDAAPEALASYAERYAPAADHAGMSFPSTVAFDVVERVPGEPTTAFAAPECRRPFPQVTARAERAKVTPAAAVSQVSGTRAEPRTPRLRAPWHST
jgi:hypothetical protein